MVWKRRACGEKLYHHIYAWGNDRHPVFKAKGHYHEYLRLMEKNSDYYRIDIIAYALMEWHVHLFIYDKKNNVSDFMFRLHGDYAQFYNRNTNRVGHVFGERFNNKIVQPNQYGVWLSRYIHLQAVEAGIVQDPGDYPWTSYAAFVGHNRSSFVKSDVILDQFGNGAERYHRYKEFVLNESTTGDSVKTIKGLRMANAKYMIAIASHALSVDQARLLYPKGRDERKKRRDAIRLLIDKYEYKRSDVAIAFHLSRAAVTLCLRDK